MTQGNNRAQDPLQQEFDFDKFVRDIERREEDLDAPGQEGLAEPGRDLG